METEMVYLTFCVEVLCSFLGRWFLGNNDLGYDHHLILSRLIRDNDSSTTALAILSIILSSGAGCTKMRY